MAGQISMFASDPSLISDPLHYGQWRLARVEVVNWGTFSGFHVLPVSRKGLLITGESGSGKSTLLDAVTTVLTPPRSRRLNAAAKSEGARGEDRTVYSYIRGAWNSETDTTGEVASAYLRPSRATWSGILLRYERSQDRPEEAINLVALFHLKAGSVNRDGFGEMYAVVRGDCSLPDFAPYAQNGIDRARFGREWKRSPERHFAEHSTFAAHFTQLMGLQGNKTLELLHRTQAAKNFGSLDELFRNFMLERPRTFDQADEAVAQFSALDRAYAMVVDQRRQMQCLQPLEDLDKKCEEDERKLEQITRLKQVLQGYTEMRALEAIDDELERQRRESDRLASDVDAAQTEFDLSGAALAQAQAALDGAGGFAMDAAEKDLLVSQQRLQLVERDRHSLAARIAGAGFEGDLPSTFEEWGALQRSLKKAAEAQAARAAELRDETGSRYAQVKDIQDQMDAIERELRHLRGSPTNIPREYASIRGRIAQRLGIAPRELPFVGELISVKDRFSTWQGAIERVLNSQARTLLVAHDYARAVASFVDGEHLGLRFEFEDVPVDVEVPPVDYNERSLIARVEVKLHDTHPEYSRWVNRLLRTRFDYACVDSPDQLARSRKALTIAGQVKNGNRYIKDDRHALNDRTRWILGFENDTKQRELAARLQDLETKLKQAKAAAEEATGQMMRTDKLIGLSESVQDEKWESYDIAAAQDQVDKAQRFRNSLRQDNEKLAGMQRLRDEAKARHDAADEQLRRARLGAERTSERIARLADEREGHEGRLQASEAPASDDVKALDKEFSKIKQGAKEDSIAWLYRAANVVLNRLSGDETKTAESLRRTRSEVERIIADYRRDWPAQAADFRMDFEGREEYLRVYRRIVASGLPSYERQFLKVLHDFSQDQITVLSTTIRNAIHEVRDRIRQVNSSLMLSEYSPGIHLQIDVRECRSPQATEFLRDLRSITEGSWNEEDIASAEQRYLKTSKIINRLRGGDYADQRWKADCIDTRRHVGFVAKEIDDSGTVQSVHANDAGLSGGQKQKLVIFCLAAALRYQLADEAEPIPSYGTVILDEAFDKADHRYANTAMDIFEAFGFHMVLATPMKLLQTVESHIGGIAHIQCRDRRESTITMVEFELDDEGDDESVGAE